MNTRTQHDSRKKIIIVSLMLILLSVSINNSSATPAVDLPSDSRTINLNPQADNSSTKSQHSSPVDFRVTLAGNFAEIRSNHFHSGIDIKATNGIGSPIRATADGYISRIGVSPTGYGRVLYITHPDRGEMTVYAHLHSFSAKIQKWVESEQIRRESFKVDLYPDASMFPIKRGEQIATLGNSGSSAGPHLHYEIRKLASHNPINPLDHLGISVPDRVSPTIASIYLYEIDTLLGTPLVTLKQSIKLQTSANNIVTVAPGQDSVLRISKPSYIAYQVIDHKDGKTNTMGISALEQKLDSTVNFAFKIDHINFKTTRYINSMTQYDKNRETSRYDVIRAYVSPNNLLNTYTTIRNRGIILPQQIATSENGTRIINTTIYDEQGNSTTLSIPIALDTNSGYNPIIIDPRKVDSTIFGVQWNKNFNYKTPEHSLQIEPRSFYESTIIEITADNQKNTINITPLSSAIPLHKAATLEFKNPNSVPHGLESKATVVSIDKKGKIRNAGGEMNSQDRILRTKINILQTYGVAIDSIAPSIVLKDPSKANKLHFTIKDDLSGINSYRLTIDGKWVIAEYDPRRSALVYEFIRSSNPSNHQVRLEVRDAKNNKTTFEKQIKW